MLDIQKNYLDKGEMFWVAIDEDARVIGSVGYSSIDGTTEVILHRLYVKCSLKHQGIGSALLQTAEAYIKTQDKTSILVNLSGGLF